MSTLEIIAVIVSVVGGLRAIEYVYEKITRAHDRAKEWDRFEENDTEIRAKIQQMQAEQCMLTYCMFATLDGLHQLGCNGKVSEARNELNKFMNKQAHEVD